MLEGDKTESKSWSASASDYYYYYYYFWLCKPFARIAEPNIKRNESKLKLNPLTSEKPTIPSKHKLPFNQSLKQMIWKLSSLDTVATWVQSTRISAFLFNWKTALDQKKKKMENSKIRLAHKRRLQPRTFGL